MHQSLRLFRWVVVSGVASILIFSTVASADEGIMMNKAVASRQVEAASQEWEPLHYHYTIGYESTSSVTGPLGKNAMVFGVWNHLFGMDFLFGLSKPTDSVNVSTVTSVADTTSSTSGQTITTSYTGSSNPLSLTIGFKPKLKLFQNNWIQIYSAFLMGITKTFDNSYQKGTHVETYADRSDTGNYSVTETGYGTESDSTSLQYFGGPQIGSEFYLRWIPHLALGFATGLFLTTGGNTTSNTPVGTKTYAVVNGAAQPPSAGSSTNTVSSNDLGVGSNTFGAGGSVFSLFSATFTVRYVW